jgi:microcystin-dependent protein
MNKQHWKHSVALATLALFATAEAQACASEPEVGSVCMTAAGYCSVNYIEAKGQLLSINQYTALFSLLGTTYGGDGRTNFGVPDLQSRSPVGIGQGAGLQPVNPGAKRGTESVAIGVNNLPPHSHTVNNLATSIPVSANTANNKLAPDATFNKLAASASGPSGAAIWSDTQTSPVNAAAGKTSGTTDPTGSGAPVAILPPQLGVRFCIATTGTYPSRP